MKNASPHKPSTAKPKAESKQIKYVRKFLETKSKKELIEINITSFECNTRMQNNIIAMLAIGHRALD